MNSNREKLDEIIRTANASGYFQLLDMEILEADRGKSRVRVVIGDKHRNSFGTVHGGVYCSALDAAIFFACFSTLESGKNMTSLEIKTNFLVPARSGEIIAEGSAAYQGRTILVGDGRVVDPSGTLLAKGVGTCIVLPQPKA